MSTRDSSAAASPVSSSTDIRPDNLPKGTFGTLGSTAKATPRSSVKPNGAPEAVREEAKLKDNRSTSNEDPAQLDSQTTQVVDSTPTCDPAFNFSDTNIQIRTGNRLFRIHQFKLNEFDRLRPKLEQATKDDKERKTIKLKDNADDFHNLLVVLYSSVYGCHLFSSATLKSTLKLATKYAHPTLRIFAIKELEKHTLEPIDRFTLSRDCGVTEWMSKALDDLCWREEPITVIEAQILGSEKFVEVAARREGIKFERGSRVYLGNGQLTKRIEANSELFPSSGPITHDLEGILVASSNLLAGTSRTVQPKSKGSSDLTVLSHNAATAQMSSDQPRGGSPDGQPIILLPRFANPNGKPLPFPLGFKFNQPEASAPDSFQTAKNTGAAGKPPT